MLCVVLNDSWKQHPTKQQLYGHLPPHLKNHSSEINKTCKALREKEGQTHKQHFSMDPYTWMCHFWPTSKNFHLHQLCADTRCNLKDQLEATYDKEEWRGRVRKVHAVSLTWWWDIYISVQKVIIFYQKGYKHQWKLNLFKYHQQKFNPLLF